ncbi:MAG: regulatory signaling modulator protein AmpE [Candidatus Thiodiazotropha sp.]
MTFTIVLICLIAERFMLDALAWRNDRWFFRYTLWYQAQSLPNGLQRGSLGLVTLLLPPLLAVALVQQILDGALWGFLDVAFALAVLLAALGPEDLDQQINRYVDAREQDDDEAATEVARHLIEDEPPTSEPARSQAVAESALQLANRRIFAVLFWFILLGPLGAALYRLASWLPRSDQSAQSIDYRLNALQLVYILDWLPARVTAFCYAVAGSFEDALYGWRSFQEQRYKEFSDANSGILVCTGSGAMRLSTLLDETQSGAQVYAYLPKAAMALIWRSLIVFMAMLAFASLSGLV